MTRTSPIRVFIINRSLYAAEAVGEALGLCSEFSFAGASDPSENPPWTASGVGRALLLIDKNVGLSSALEWVEHWSRQDGTKVVVSGVNADRDEIIEFIQAGAVGYVLSTDPLPVLIDKLRDVRLGRFVCSQRITSGLCRRIAALSRPREQISGHYASLTEREKEVLNHMAEGSSNKEIATALEISVHTVKNHVHNILDKLQVSRRQEAIRRAMNRGILNDGVR